MAQSRWLIAGAGAALVGAVALVAARSNRAVKPAPVSSASVAASAWAPPVSSVPPQPRMRLEYAFDCAGLPDSAAACSGASPLAAKLVESSLWTLTGMPACAGALKGDRAESAARALRDALALAREKLPPLERALLQNAALRLLSCSANVEQASLRKEIEQNAKRLVKAFALDVTEIAALPASATELGVLGDGSSWQVGKLRTHLHESSDGYVSTVERARHEQNFASIYRLIVQDDKGELHATDVASKLTLRRPEAEPGHFTACIATLDPASAHCNAAVLRPVSPALQTEALTHVDGPPTCHQCHVQNHANSLSFGPETGLGPDSVTLDLARASLAKVLGH